MSDLSDLFALDPLKMSNKDFEEVIKHLRNSRHQFNSGNIRAGSTKPKTVKQKEVLAIADQLDL